MIELKTKRLDLRETDQSDASLLSKLQAREGVADYIGEFRIKPPNSHFFTILRKQTRLGQVSLVARAGLASNGFEIICALLPEAEGCGIATEACQRVFQWALEDLHLSVIFARVHEDNRESLALIGRLGMEEHAPRNADGETIYVKHLLPAT
jgi:RimJ/RimL family protein N-acetyltransferase